MPHSQAGFFLFQLADSTSFLFNILPREIHSRPLMPNILGAISTLISSLCFIFISLVGWSPPSSFPSIYYIPESCVLSPDLCSCVDAFGCASPSVTPTIESASGNPRCILVAVVDSDGLISGLASNLLSAHLPTRSCSSTGIRLTRLRKKKTLRCLFREKVGPRWKRRTCPKTSRQIGRRQIHLRH